MKPMTKKQRVIVFGFFALLVASYFIRAIGMAALQMANYRPRISRPKPKPKATVAPKTTKSTAPTLPAIPAPAPPTVVPTQASAAAIPPAPAVLAPAVAPRGQTLPPSLLRAPGIWRGAMAVDGRGVCNLRVEIRLRADDLNPFSGFITAACAPTLQFTPTSKMNAKALTLDKMDPEASIMIGAIDGESINFRLDKTVVTDTAGCGPTGLIITPFGNDLFAAEWKDGACAGGHLILRRARA